MEKVKSAESYIRNHPLWSKELLLLRDIIIKTELVEELKWGMPVYTLDNKNVVGITGFKNFFGLWFYQGSFLSDPNKILRNAQEGKTKGMRHLNFSNVKDINKTLVSSYVDEAIANQKAGKVIKVERKKIMMPPELKLALAADEKLTEAFGNLATGKQNEYKEYILSAKQDKTKARRLEKIIPMIMIGVGLSDKYR